MAAYDDNQDGKIEIREVSIYSIFLSLSFKIFWDWQMPKNIHYHPFYYTPKHESMTNNWIKARIENKFLINYFYNNYFWF